MTLPLVSRSGHSVAAPSVPELSGHQALLLPLALPGLRALLLRQPCFLGLQLSEARLVILSRSRPFGVQPAVS